MKATIIAISLVSLLLLTKIQAEHGVRGLTNSTQKLDPSCEVTNLVVYYFDETGESHRFSLFSGILDLTDFYQGKVNIQAEVTKECQPQCVKFSYDGRIHKERVRPYFLYGNKAGGAMNKGSPRRSGEVKACLYTDRNCSQGEQGCSSMNLDLIPANSPLKAGPLDLKPFTLNFDSTVGPATTEETTAAVDAICKVISEFWGFGAFYRADVGVNDFVCTGTAMANTNGAALSITFDTTASVHKSTFFNPYRNLLLPDAETLYTAMTTLLGDNGVTGPNGPQALAYFVEILDDASNPYSALTRFTVV